MLYRQHDMLLSKQYNDQELIEKAKSNNPGDLYSLGIFLLDKKGSEQDGIKYLKMASELGNERALRHLWGYYYFFLKNREDDSYKYLKQCWQHNSHTAFSLGLGYYTGHADEKWLPDYKKALECFEYGAERGWNSCKAGYLFIKYKTNEIFLQEVLSKNKEFLELSADDYLDFYNILTLIECLDRFEVFPLEKKYSEIIICAYKENNTDILKKYKGIIRILFITGRRAAGELSDENIDLSSACRYFSYAVLVSKRHFQTSRTIKGYLDKLEYYAMEAFNSAMPDIEKISIFNYVDACAKTIRKINYITAYACFCGCGVERDISKAFEYSKKAMDINHLAAFLYGLSGYLTGKTDKTNAYKTINFAIEKCIKEKDEKSIILFCDIFKKENMLEELYITCQYIVRILDIPVINYEMGILNLYPTKINIQNLKSALEFISHSAEQGYESAKDLLKHFYKTQKGKIKFKKETN